MFETITPEQAGIPSKQVLKYVSFLERRGMTTHSLLMMKGDKVFAEYYWAPFNKDFCHRMYSQTKSYVSIAIGLLLEEGKLSLDDKMSKHFPEKIEGELAPELKNLTIKQMLTMSTAGKPQWWFNSDDPDRTHMYFSPRKSYRAADTLWEYDSAGSQVLCNLVEKLSGMSLFDFLNERIFKELGTFKTAQILKTRNGVSWGDSALICTTRDMASMGRLLLNKGNWQGKQLISADYVREATSKVVDNKQNAFETAMSHGYGYQIWRTEQNGFAFNGMGSQYTICLPDKDLLFVITSDNQGYDSACDLIINGYFDIIVAAAQDTPLKENEADYKELCEFTSGLELRSVKGNADSPLRASIENKTYICEPNDMGIEKFSFVFSGDRGEFRYTNAQGDKVIPFGINKNVFGKFPQLGYSNEVGGKETTDGFMYNDAVSLCFVQDNRILMKVQIIDKYFGNFSALFGFVGDSVTCNFTKTAENFLNEYQGTFNAKAQ